MLSTVRGVGRSLCLLLVGCSLLAVAAPIRGAIAQDCNLEPGRPVDAASVRGTAFIGTFRGDDTWDVEETLAGDPLGDTLEYDADPCQPLDFVAGVRYLVSTSSPERPDSYTTVAYRLLPDDHARLVQFESAVPRELYPPEFRVGTLAEAIALVAPDAVLPDTSTADPGLLDGVASLLASLGRFLSDLVASDWTGLRTSR